MSQYSEIMGSFVRTGNYPLEANYIFSTLDELNEFYSIPINKATLHSGLLRIVEDEKALYWAIPNNSGELIFEKLIDNLELIKTLDLDKALKEEINKRIEADNGIYGTVDPTEIDHDLNTILKLSKAILNLKDELKEVENTHLKIEDDIKAIVGSDSDEIIEYLETLDYKNLTIISEVLNTFFNTKDEGDITTWIELEEFLDGFTTDKNLKLILKEIIDTFNHKLHNILHELDNTQSGVGLSGDGSYNSDKETYYLQDATSVMNALKILDSLINQAINNCNLQVKDSNSVSLDIVKESDKTTISALVKVSSENGNDILTKNDGIYHTIDSEYENGILTIKVNGNVRKLHILGLSSIVEKAGYNPTTEEIQIIFKLQNGDKLEVIIPVGALIQEWIVDNSNSTVELNKVRNINGPDTLSANVKISTNKYNILEIDGDKLLVKGLADNIVFNGDVTVKSKIESLVEHDSEIENSISDLTLNLNTEITAIKEFNKDLDLSLKNEIKRSTERDELLTEQLTDEIKRAKSSEKTLEDDLNSEITRSTNKDSELETNLSNEITRSTNKDNDLNKRIDDLKDYVDSNFSQDSELKNKVTLLEKDLNLENVRAQLAELNINNSISNLDTKVEALSTVLNNKIESLESTIQNNVNTSISLLRDNLNNEINRSTNKDEALEKAILDEILRAKDSEKDISDAVKTEKNRAELKEIELEGKIENESNRAKAAELLNFDELHHYIVETDNNLANKADKIHSHTMSDISDLETTSVIKGFVELLTDLPDDALIGDKYILKYSEDGIYKWTLVERREGLWTLKLLTNGNIVCIDGDGVYLIDSSGLKRINVKVNESINQDSDIEISWSNDGLSAKIIWGEYD